jgi:hypothetical protein
MVPRAADEVVSARRRARCEHNRLAEDGAPVRAARTEVGLRREGDVDLKTPRQQEDPIDCRGKRQIPVVEGCEISVDQIGPVLKDWRQFAAEATMCGASLARSRRRALTRSLASIVNTIT